jgi:ABC-type multidrug transport system permease subunit
MSRTRRRRDRSVLPILSMFLFGLFLMLGTSPGSVFFDSVFSLVSPYVQAAFLLALVLVVYLLYDQVYVPLQQLNKAFRWGGVLAMVSLVLAFLGGIYLLVDEKGVAFLLMALLLWKLTVQLSYRKRRR